LVVSSESLGPHFFVGVTPLPILAVLGTLAAAVAFAVVFDFVKVPAFRRLGIS
jgi:hypothetical protein